MYTQQEWFQREHEYSIAVRGPLPERAGAAASTSRTRSPAAPARLGIPLPRQPHGARLVQGGADHQLRQPARRGAVALHRKRTGGLRRGFRGDERESRLEAAEGHQAARRLPLPAPETHGGGTRAARRPHEGQVHARDAGLRPARAGLRRARPLDHGTAQGGAAERVGVRSRHLLGPVARRDALVHGDGGLATQHPDRFHLFRYQDFDRFAAMLHRACPDAAAGYRSAIRTARSRRCSRGWSPTAPPRARRRRPSQRTARRCSGRWIAATCFRRSWRSRVATRRRPCGSPAPSCSGIPTMPRVTSHSAAR